MNKNHVDYLQREEQILKEEWRIIKERIRLLEGNRMPEVLWLKNRYLYLKQNLSYRIGSIETEIRDEEEREQDGHAEE